MNQTDIREHLSRMSDATRGDFHAEAEDLLNALGYKSERKLDYDGTYDDFISEYDPERFNSETQAARSLKNAVKSIKDVFQVTTEEIAENAEPVQGDLGILSDTDVGRAESFLFVSAILKGDSYPRGQYAAFTRVINRINEDWPTVVLFQTAANLVSLAFINRRQNKRDAERDVLGSVSLIREINPSKPHHAHVKILEDLSLAKRLSWMESRDRRANFDGLLSAWLNALDTEELNKRFYDELFGWFQRAVAEAKFPKTGRRAQSPEEHVIRLITRLMFVWFVKEKGLVADDLLIETQVSKKLKDYDAEKGDSYYRAVLQNLFFATLNTEVGERRFRAAGNRGHRVFNHYRYKSEMSDPDGLEALFSWTPFINGGLFDCLDSEKATGEGGYRIDCFTDNPNHRRGFSIPNRLFFGTSPDSLGLIPLFEKYKFTVEENTPVEQEVALDPELLGKVFENLLAAYNPETRETARKQTGSYYTPRPVVDYMVDEALVASLSEKTLPDGADESEWQNRLRDMLDYSYPFEEMGAGFDAGESRAIVEAVAGLRALDPAVGSGAFPMGILHKLTLALRRVDPENNIWEELQKRAALERMEDALGASSQQARADEVDGVRKTFEKYRDSDFGRKLYLIQNSIYGVDIQPVATQIAKLRFFISLAIEQTPDDDASNRGIRPLPNLETRFVAANTLIALGQATQIPLGGSNRVTELTDELRQNREQHFHAGVRQEKLHLRREDHRLRRELAIELAKVGMPKSDAGKIADWNPYDQNANAAWFDARYMFDVADGFDIVIGNPPYINVENLSGDMRRHLMETYVACEKRTDIYIAFMEKSLSLLNPKGTMSLIIPAAFTKQKYATKMRSVLIKNHAIREIVDASDYRIFENAVVYNVILTVGKSKRGEPTAVRIHRSNSDFENRSGAEFEVDQDFYTSLKDSRFDTNPSIGDAIPIRQRMWKKSIRFDKICLVAYGARLNHKSKKMGKAAYISPTRKRGSKRFLEGANIERYSFSQAGWLSYKPDEHYNPMFGELFENPKIMFIRVVKERLRSAYDDSGFYNSHTVINCVRLDRLRGASHRTAVSALKKASLATARQYDNKYLLGVLNSTAINWYFLNFLSDKLNFYPNDAKELPIPRATATQQSSIIALVDRILEVKAADAGADTAALEAEIDRLVYDLYGLTDEETASIERSIA